MNQLEKIIRTKRKEITKLSPRSEFLRKASLEKKHISLGHTLSKSPNQLKVIAEIKKTSPSCKENFAETFLPIERALSYEKGGASMISVLTDKTYFSGSLQNLSQISEKITLPLLRKDFILDKVQIYESAVAGANAILLIKAILDIKTLKALYREARIHRLDVILEIHTQEELDSVLEIENITYLAINNRNLKTFEVDIKITEKLSPQVPEDIFLISASGICTEEVAQQALDSGANGILIGESLMRSTNPEELIQRILQLRRNEDNF